MNFPLDVCQRHLQITDSHILAQYDFLCDCEEEEGEGKGEGAH